MHWLSIGGDVGWMFVPGVGKTNVQVDEKQMSIYLADPAAKEFEIMVYAKNKSTANFQEDSWNLEPMKIGIKTTLHKISAVVMDRDSVQNTIETPVYYPFMFKIIYEIPVNWNVKEPLVILAPEYK